MCIGLTYTDNAFVHPETKNCRDLIKEIVSGIQSHDELKGIELTSIQINHNAISAPHTVNIKVGFPSFAVRVGDYVGGKLRVDGCAPTDLRSHAVVLGDLKTHYTSMLRGAGWYVVLFAHAYRDSSGGDGQRAPTVRFTVPSNVPNGSPCSNRR